MIKKTLLILLLPIIMFATVYRVSTVTEIEAINNLNAGDTVMIDSGYYSDVDIRFTGNGALHDSVVFMAQEPGKVIFYGNSTLSFAGNYIKISGLFFTNGYSTSGKAVIEFRLYTPRANNSRVTNCAILNYNPVTKDIDYKWLSMYGKNNRVDHCRFEGKKHSGTTFVIWLQTLSDRPNNHRVDHNYFGPRPDLGYNGGETIRIGTSDYSLTDSRTIIEYNVFEECNGEIEIISNKSCENIYRHNTFINNKGTLTLRHGNRCLVEGNYFFGNNLSDAGGIRIIGEDHIVINNYLQDIPGSGYRSGICIVRGVENSPLNRYFPVKRAIIANNTLVNVRYPLSINYAGSDDQTVPPDSSVIINNAVNAGSSYDVLDIRGIPTRFVWAGNVFYGEELGAPDPGGITWCDPLLELSQDKMYRPAPESPLIAAAAMGYYDVQYDMDGHERSGIYDVGADEVSDIPPVYHPLSKENTGPDWNVELETITEVAAGENTLSTALKRIAPGDTLKLITPSGNYSLSEGIEIDMEIALISDFEGDERPVIFCNNSEPVFTLKNRSKLYLKNVHVDGYNIAGSKTSLISSASYTSGLQTMRFVANNCLFAVSGVDLPDVSCLNISRFVRADSIYFNDCEFRGFSETVLCLDDVISESADFRAENLILKNSTFWNNNKGVLSIDGADSNPFTIGPRVIIDRCTIDDCADPAYITLNLKEIDVAEIHNSIISNSSADTAAVSLYGWGYIDNSNIYESGNISLYRGGNINEGMINIDPNYRDPANGDFTIPWGNPLLTAGSENDGIGDPRWIPDYTAREELNTLPESINIHAYPNPTNGNIRIDYSFVNNDKGKLYIYDVNGTLFKKIGLKNKSTCMNLDLNDFSSGIWLFCISDGIESITQKVMILK